MDRIEDEEMRISSHLAPGMNLKLKETQIGSETCRNIKTLQSSLKRKNKATVLISTKIPIRQEKSPISSRNVVNKSINADCHHHYQTGGQDGGDGRDGGDGGDDGGAGSLKSVSTQTDKNGCSVM